MRTRERLNVYLGGVSLRDVDSRILIRAFREEDAETDATYGRNPGWPGQRLLGLQRVAKRVSVVFAIRELYDLGARTEILDRVNQWARAGILTASTRPARRLRVRPETYATAASVRDYTEEYTVRLIADSVPFWEDEQAETAAYTGGNQEIELLVRGSAPTPLEATFIKGNGSLSSFTIGYTDADGKFRIFTVQVPALAYGREITMGYDENGYLRIASGTTVLHQTPASPDEILLAPGKQTIEIRATAGAMTGTLSARGRWL